MKIRVLLAVLGAAAASGCDSGGRCRSNVIVVDPVPALYYEEVHMVVTVAGRVFSLPCSGSAGDPAKGEWHASCDPYGRVVVSGPDLDLGSISQVIVDVTTTDGRVFARHLAVPLGEIYRPDPDGDPAYCQREGKARLTPSAPPGGALAFEPEVPSFDPVRVGETGPFMKIGLFNRSAVVAGTPVIALTGDFVEGDSTCTDPVPIGSRCDVEIAFAPRSPGFQTGTLTVTSEGGGSSTTNLQGKGLF